MSGAKTQEKMAEEYADIKHNYNPNFPRDVQQNYDIWLETYQDFLAGYKAGSQRTDAELFKAFFDIKEKDSLGPKIASFLNGMRRGLKQVRDYDENA